MTEFILTLLLTFKLALFTTIILLIFGIPLSFYLAFSKSKLKSFFHTLISLPLVLPPTVIGYYLLVAFSPENALGKFLKSYFHFQLAFSFEGILLGSVIYSSPFMIQPLESGLKNLPSSIKEAAYSLGKSKFVTLFKVLLPSIKPSLLMALVLTFAHTIGEFGIVLMIGGSIPGETKVASIAIFNEVEALNYSSAKIYSLILFTLCFLILFIVNVFNSQNRNKFE